MENEISAKKTIKIWGIFKKSFSLYKENFLLFITISIIGHGTLFLLGGLLKSPYAGLTIIGTLPASVISIWASIALIIAVSNRYLNNKIKFKECFVKAIGKIRRFIAISILYPLIVGTGLLLFLIPAIYWGTIFSLAAIVVVLEITKGDLGPFRRSKELIKGSFGKVFLIGLISLTSYFLLYFIPSKINLYLVVTILTDIFCILYTSFFTVITIVLYHKLREKKETESPIEKKSVINEGRGVCGCLTTIGFIVLIFVLISAWSTFFETEKGAQVSEYIKKTISPQINFPDDVTIPRPKGWLVIRKDISPPGIKYDLIRFGPKEIRKFNLWSISIKDLNISKPISLDNPLIKKGILDNCAKHFELSFGQTYNDYTPQPIKTITLGDRSWGEYTFEKREESKYVNRIWVKVYIHKNFYTIFKDYILVASYRYRYHSTDTEEAEKRDELLKEEKEIENILSSFHFPKETRR